MLSREGCVRPRVGPRSLTSRKSTHLPGAGMTVSTCSPGGGRAWGRWPGSTLQAVTWLQSCQCRGSCITSGSWTVKTLSHLPLRLVLVCARRPEVATSSAPFTLQVSCPGG